MAHTKIPYIKSNLALILNHQSSQYITENPCKNQNHPHTVNQEDKINHGAKSGLLIYIQFQF